MKAQMPEKICSFKWIKIFFSSLFFVVRDTGVTDEERGTVFSPEVAPHFGFFFFLSSAR